MLGASDEPAVRDADPLWHRSATMPVSLPVALPQYVPPARRRRSPVGTVIAILVVLAAIIVVGVRFTTVMPRVESWLRQDPPAATGIDPGVLTGVTKRVGTEVLGYIDIPENWVPVDAVSVGLDGISDGFAAWCDPLSTSSAVALYQAKGVAPVETIVEAAVAAFSGDPSVQTLRVRLLGRGATRVSGVVAEDSIEAHIWAVAQPNKAALGIMIVAPTSDNAIVSMIDTYSKTK
jgi:hypothetical protein